MDKLNFTITGIAPLLMHNSRGADPLHPLTKQLKALTGKRNQTDADRERIAEAEYYVSLYTGKDNEPIIPANMLLANIILGAKKEKMGKQAKAGVLVLDDMPLQFEGPKTPTELFKAGYLLRTPVKNKQATIIRTRPRFEDWHFKCEVLYDDGIVQPDQVKRWLELGGIYEGLGDWRPQHGRFTVS